MVYDRKGSKSIEPDRKQRMSIYMKKEKSNDVRRPSRAQHTTKEETIHVQEEPEQPQPQVKVTDAGEWFGQKDALVTESDLKPKQQAEEKPPLDKAPPRYSITGELVTIEETEHASKRDSIKTDLRAVDEEFNVAMGDIRSEVIETTVEDELPVISIVEEQDEDTSADHEQKEEAELFEEIPNPSRVSLFSRWEFQEV